MEKTVPRGESTLKKFAGHEFGEASASGTPSQLISQPAGAEGACDVRVKSAQIGAVDVHGRQNAGRRGAPRRNRTVCAAAGVAPAASESVRLPRMQGHSSGCLARSLCDSFRKAEEESPPTTSGGPEVACGGD